MASSRTLHAKIAPILTLRLVLAPKSSKSPPYAYLSRRLCFKIVEIPSLRGHSKFLHAQNILQDGLLNFRHPKIFDMRHELNLRRTKIFDMGYEKFQGSTYRTFRTSVMLWNCVGTLLLPLKLNFYFTPVEIEILNDQPTDKRSFLGGNQKRLRFFTPQRGRIGSFGSNIFS